MGAKGTKEKLETYRKTLITAVKRARRKPAVTLREASLYHLRSVFPSAVSRELRGYLDRVVFPLMTRITCPIPPESITRMRVNYSEKLEKTMRVRSLDLNGYRSARIRSVERTPLLQLMRSNELRELAECVTGLRLRSNVECQALCYEAGDYTGPHNDHHPEIPSARDGYVDVHIVLPNEAVASQALVFEEKGLFTGSIDLGRFAGILVYKLPFWHYTTPLRARLGRQESARRWLLLCSYDVERKAGEVAVEARARVSRRAANQRKRYLR